MSSEGDLLGVVVMTRHGDRQGFYQDPKTYTPTLTTVTPLGTQQEFQLGQLLRNLYLDPSSSSFIKGINYTLADQTQILARADAGGEAGVILDSAASLLQGLFPANENYTTSLANGTTVASPLGGIVDGRSLPVESVEPDNDISLEGWTSCGAFNDATNNFYNSAEFRTRGTEAADFLGQLPKYLDGRPVTLENMWNVFDFMLVQSIHNKAFKDALPETFLEQGRALANWHEYNVFTSSEIDGVGNIAGRTILPSVMEGFARIANETDPLKIMYMATSYKPFLSLFNMTGVASANPELAGFVNYAGAVVWEVRKSSDGGPVLRFNFKNGTADNSFKQYNFMDSTGDVSLATFVNHVAPATINSTATWCGICGNVQDRGCGALVQAENVGRMKALPAGLSVADAGALGAGVALAFSLCVISLLACLGFVSLGRRQKYPPSVRNSDLVK
ncbi:phosphoglycerate mutase-like protein [Pluteus cervinus]|uniref:Phosphoglycerate mutase-like protein n=1 Tax=Pluteus cervinus TaxID=181527 RepID=A0ACD3AYE7_9AGAR|nr:phosphoglycerate mutase-like protein [Pluteus cervinus]